MSIVPIRSPQELDALSRPEPEYEPIDEGPGPWADEPMIGARPARERLPGLNVVSVAELLAGPDVPVPFHVPGLIPAVGVAVLAGDPKCGKTLAMNQIALTTGSELEDDARPRFLGRKVATGPVVCVVEEGSRDGLAQKARRQIASLGLADRPRVTYVYRQRIRLDDRRSTDELRTEIERARPALVVMDPLNRLHSRDENRPTEMTPVMDAAAAIAYDFGCAVVLVHHLTKPVPGTRRDGAERLRGAGAIRSGTDANLTMTDLGAGMVRIQGEFRDAEDVDLCARLDPATLLFEATDRPESDGKIPRGELLAFVDERREVTAREVMVAFGVKSKRIALTALDDAPELDAFEGPRGIRTFFRIGARA